MEMMLAYHGNKAVKDKFMKRVRAHREADELIQGATQGRGPDGDFKGCAVVCTIGEYSHLAYETELGVPRAVARIEDGIFEGLAPADALAWPEQFLEAIPIGADLSGVVDRFLHWLLVDPVDGVIQYAKTEKQKQAIQAVGDLYARKLKGETISLDDWRLERKAAAAADADAAAYAATAYAAADAAAYAAAAYAAYAATAYAYADAAAAAYAATAYADADAAAAAYADADADAARRSARKKQAEKLIALLKSAPVIKETDLKK